MFEEYESVLTVEEACEALRIGKSRLYMLLREGKLRGYREGRHWKVTRDELNNYVRKGNQRVG